MSKSIKGELESFMQEITDSIDKARTVAQEADVRAKAFQAEVVRLTNENNDLNEKIKRKNRTISQLKADLAIAERKLEREPYQTRGGVVHPQPDEVGNTMRRAMTEADRFKKAHENADREVLIDLQRQLLDEKSDLMDGGAEHFDTVYLQAANEAKLGAVQELLDLPQRLQEVTQADLDKGTFNSIAARQSENNLSESWARRMEKVKAMGDVQLEKEWFDLQDRKSSLPQIAANRIVIETWERLQKAIEDEQKERRDLIESVIEGVSFGDGTHEQVQHYLEKLKDCELNEYCQDWTLMAELSKEDTKHLNYEMLVGWAKQEIDNRQAAREDNDPEQKEVMLDIFRGRKTKHLLSRQQTLKNELEKAKDPQDRREYERLLGLIGQVLDERKA